MVFGIIIVIVAIVVAVLLNKAKISKIASQVEETVAKVEKTVAPAIEETKQILAKAEKAYIDGNLGSANNAIDKCLKDKDNKNNVMVYLLKSKIMLGISKDKNLYSKYPGALKDALKYGEKAMILLKSADMVKYGNDFVNHFQVLYDEDAYFKTLLKISNKEAMESYDLNKYAKALPMFRRSLAFSNDTQAQVLMADCYWQLGQKAESVPMFKNTAEMIYAAVLDSNSKVYGYQKEPFRKLCLYYISIKAYDSAYLIVKNGREIFPNDPVLNDYTYGLLRYNLEKIPPSIDYLNAIKMGLKDFPADSFLNHRENSIYIYFHLEMFRIFQFYYFLFAYLMMNLTLHLCCLYRFFDLLIY
jgi:thioredoxin-like negative regulator of GroEL